MSKQQLILGLVLILVLIGITLPAPSSPPLAPTATPVAVVSTPFNTPPPVPTLISQPTALSPTPEPITRLVFTGDVVPGRCVAKPLIEANDFTLPYQYLGYFLRAADITVGSLDGSITDRAAPILNCGGTMNLVGPSRMVEGLTFAGFDLFTIATNHIKDCGIVGCDEAALLDSIHYLAQGNIKSVGGGKNVAEARAPVIMERNGVRFAFLGVSEIYPTYAASETVAGFALLKTETILEDIAKAKQQADVVIVLPHWGTEYVVTPTWFQYELAPKMVNAGADLVIGNHPHWAQPVEVFADNKVVAYALGNFVMDQPWSTETQQGIVFEAIFRGKKLERWQILPIRIHHGYQPRWASPEEAKTILARLDSAFELAPLWLRKYQKP